MRQVRVLLAVLPVIALLLVLVPVPSADAADYDLVLGPMTQGQFDTFVEELAAATAYRPLAPAEPAGVPGFDVGVAVSAVRIDAALWDAVTTGSEFNDYLPVPTLRLRVGLPAGIDIGASYVQVPKSDIRALGAEVQYALYEGSTATPALAVRVTGSTLLGVDDLQHYTYGGDVVISKGFAIFTPYAGLGYMAIRGEYDGTLPANAGLAAHTTTEPRLFAGVQVALAALRLTLDYEYLKQPVYSAKLSIGF